MAKKTLGVRPAGSAPAIAEGFSQWRKTAGKTTQRMTLSWSNWLFGREDLDRSLARLRKNGIEWIELHGNRYGPDLGYKAAPTRKALKQAGMRVSGICGVFGPENDLSAPSGFVRQRALDYLRRQIELCAETGGSYVLVVPGAVGRPAPYDDMEFDRSAEMLALAAADFAGAGVRCAVEAIRSSEVSLVNTVAEAKRYLKAVNAPAIRHITADVYHMLTEEANTPQALLDGGEAIVNLHMADSNRGALGDGQLALDEIIRALYLKGHQKKGFFVTFEPLGPAANPYRLMFGRPDDAYLDRLVEQSVRVFQERENALLLGTDA